MAEARQDYAGNTPTIDSAGALAPARVYLYRLISAGSTPRRHAALAGAAAIAGIYDEGLCTVSQYLSYNTLLLASDAADRVSTTILEYQ